MSEGIIPDHVIPTTQPRRQESAASRQSKLSSGTAAPVTPGNRAVARFSSPSEHSQQSYPRGRPLPAVSNPYNSPKALNSGSPVEVPQPLKIRKSEPYMSPILGKDGNALASPRINIRPSESFAVRSIDFLVLQNPAIETGLKLLKKTIKEHEADIENSKHVLETEMHKKMWEACLKIKNLEKRLEGKTSIVSMLELPQIITKKTSTSSLKPN